jgi:hypothetical protein
MLTIRAVLNETRQPSAPLWTDHGARNCMCSYCIHERSWMDLAEKLDTAYLNALNGHS